MPLYSRKVVREQLGASIKAKMETAEGLLVFFEDFKKIDDESKSPIGTIGSAGTNRIKITARGYAHKYNYEVGFLVLRYDRNDENYEEDAGDDILDTVSDSFMEWMEENNTGPAGSVVGGDGDGVPYWKSNDLVSISNILPITVKGGNSYWMETYTIVVEVY